MHATEDYGELANSINDSQIIFCARHRQVRVCHAWCVCV